MDSIVEFFVEGAPVTQPRDTPAAMLPSIQDVDKGLTAIKKDPTVTSRSAYVRTLWHFFRKRTRGTTRGVPKEHKVHAWKACVKTDYRLHSRRVGIARIEFPIVVDLVFVFVRPKSKTRKRSANLRYWRDGTPDIDNLSKAVLDALNEFAWVDDAQIVKFSATKLVAGDGDKSGVAIRIAKAPLPIETWADEMIRAGIHQKGLELKSEKEN